MFRQSILLITGSLETVQFQSPPNTTGQFPKLRIAFSSARKKSGLKEFGPYTLPIISVLPLIDPLMRRKLSSGSVSLASSVKSRLFFIKMPTPRLLLEEWEKNEYEQYGLVLNIFEQSEDADTKFLLHILISDSKIMSLFSFVIPYIFFI